MGYFVGLPSELDVIKAGVDYLMDDEEDRDVVRAEDLGGDFDIDEYRQRDDVEVVEEGTRNGEPYFALVPQSDEAREMLEPGTSVPVDSPVGDGGSNPGEPNNGGENNMGDFTEEDDLVDLSDDVDEAQNDMYDALAEFGDYLEDTFEELGEEVDVTLREAAEAIEYINETMGAMMNTQLHDYETVTEYTDMLESEVDDYAQGIAEHLDTEFADTDKYAAIRRNSESMDRRRDNFRDNMGLN
jgi:uncharacterized protein YdhG (YjbR/CyaY superfamily)